MAKAAATAALKHIHRHFMAKAAATAALTQSDCGLDWTGLDWTGQDWTRLAWTGLDWTALDWSGLDQTGVSHRICIQVLINIAVRLLCRDNYLTAKTDRFLVVSKESIFTLQGGLGGCRGSPDANLRVRIPCQKT